MQQSTTETARPGATKLITGYGLAAMAAVFTAAWLKGGGQTPALLGIRAEFYLFAITLLGVALLHHYSPLV